ncbi:MAG: hypothetical protein K9J21_10475 [Bacteroidales bacterium]|nr:hypothetical protein [Bacteroidales bacterium]
MTIEPDKGQDIVDVCLELTGTYKGTVDVAELNGLAIDHVFDGVTEINLPQSVIDEIKDLGARIHPVSGGIYIGDFNNDYNEDYY